MSASTSAPPSPDELAPAPTGSEAPGSPTDAPEPDRIRQLEDEVANLKDQVLRRRAEFDNYRRRVERDIRAGAEDAVASLLSDLLPSIDSLETALAAKGTLEEIRTGVEITLRDVAATLNARGIRGEDPTGARFDPARHQALSYEPVEGAEDGTVVACYRKGYLLGERLVRPALVKVAQRAEPSGGAPPEGN